MAFSMRLTNNSAAAGGSDQYFTPLGTAQWVVDRVRSMFPKKFPMVVEPSAGLGVFLPLIPKMGRVVKAWDILPQAEGITNGSFLDVDPAEFKGGLVIGNPPYGVANKMTLAFINHAAKSAEVIAFIVPRVFLRNSITYKVSLDFTPVCEEEIPNPTYYGPSGEIYKHRRLLVIWQRGEKRVVPPPPSPLPWLEYLGGPEGADAFVGCAWGDAGRVLDAPANHNRGYAHAIKALRPDTIEVLRSLEPRMIEVARMATSIPNLPKGEINYLLSQIKPKKL